MTKLFVHTANLAVKAREEIELTVRANLHAQLGFYTADINKIEPESIRALSHKLKIDINLLPASFEPEKIKLMISDMDSTLITIECIDEIADFANLKPQVSQITESAMRGEINFPESLKRRVSLLKGLKNEVLGKVYQERLQLNLGAENLIKGLRTRDIKFALVSGGFTFFTSRLASRLQIAYSKANVLGQDNQILNGTVIGDIVDGKAKQDFLLEICKELKINLSQTIAIGDGANDLPMMDIAGLSVAYRAKDVVQTQTDVQINYSSLDIVLDFLV